MKECTKCGRITLEGVCAKCKLFTIEIDPEGWAGLGELKPDEDPDLLDYINAGDKWLTDVAKGYNLSKEADAFMWPGEIRELTDHLTDLEGF
jgi:hypothetical protein